VRRSSTIVTPCASGGRFHRLLVDLASNQTLLIFSLMLEASSASPALAGGSTGDSRHAAAWPRAPAGAQHVIDLIEAGAAARPSASGVSTSSVRANLTSGGVANSVLDLMS
jgi:hypothetical protein